MVPTGGCHVYLRVPLAFKDDSDDTELAKPKKEAEIDEKAAYFTEHYTWNKITTYVQGIITGRFWIEHVGKIEVTNHRTGDVTYLDFKPSTWLGADKYKVEGQAFNRVGDVMYNISGKWIERIVAIPTALAAKSSGHKEEEETLKPPSLTRSTTSQDSQSVSDSGSYLSCHLLVYNFLQSLSFFGRCMSPARFLSLII